MAVKLMDSAIRSGRDDLEVGKDLAQTSRGLRLRYNIKLPRSQRRFVCRGCKALIIPGVNARVRLGHGKTAVLRITCDECGRVNRKILGTP